MPLLDRKGLKQNPFVRADVVDETAGPNVIVPWAQVQAALAAKAENQQIGVDLPNNVPYGDVLALADDLALVAIDFPSFSDGRAFSLARHLRNNGYKGILRARGNLIADQFAYAFACGFDEVEPSDVVYARQPEEQWLAAAKRITHTYQRNYGDPGNILDQRRAARQAKEQAHDE